MFAKQIPDPESIIDASNSLIVDQGVTVFALVVFTMVVFGVMASNFMQQRQNSAMLKQMGKESSQQDKLITQNDLNRIAGERNAEATRQTAGEMIDVKRLIVTQGELLEQLISMSTQGNAAKTNAITNGVKSIEANTESVNSMDVNLMELIKKVEQLQTDMALVLEFIAEQREADDNPTEPIKPDTAEPQLGKIKPEAKPVKETA